MQELGLALGIAIVLAIACLAMTVANYCMLRQSRQILAMSLLARGEAIRRILREDGAEECDKPATVPQHSTH